MTRRPIGVMLAAAAVGVTACGGSSKQTTTAADVTTAASATASTSATTTATTTPAKHKVHHSTVRKVHKHVLPPPTEPTTTAAQSPPPAGKTTVSGPSPISCLKAAGLSGAQGNGPQRWYARDPVTHKQVFVDGPYKNKSTAASAAQSIAAIETAKTGGLYMVSAVLTAHLEFRVSKVASCLSATSGSGSLNF